MTTVPFVRGDSAGTARAALFGRLPAPTRRPATETLVDEHHLRLDRHAPTGPATRSPVILIPPLAAPASAFDLRPGCSLLTHLVDRGHSVYLADYGHVDAADRGMGLEDWIDRIIPRAISTAADHAGGAMPVVGWSLGGTMTLLTAATHPDLPIRSIAAVGTPIDYRRIPALAPARTAARIDGGRVVAGIGRLLGGVPPLGVQLMYRLSAINRELERPLYVLRHADDEAKMRHLAAVDRFMGTMPGYPGRAFDQIWRRLIVANDLNSGTLHLGDRTIDLAAITPPVLAIGSDADAIAPAAAVEAITRVLTGTSVRFARVPGGHLGILTGPTAVDTTWRLLDDHLAD